MLVTELPATKDQVVTFTRPDDTVAQAAKVMKEAAIGCLPVLAPDNTLIGIVTERDFLNKVVAEDRDARDTRVEDIMTRDPKVVRYDTDVQDAAQLMRDGNFRHLPILNPDDQLIGIVSIRDVASFSLGEAASRSLMVSAARARRFYQAFLILVALLIYTAFIFGLVFYGEELGLR